MTERRIVVQGDLRVQASHLAPNGQDQGVDLHELGVTLDVAAIQPDQHLGCSVLGVGRQAGLRDKGRCRLHAQAVERVHVEASDGGRIGLLDVHPSARGHHDQVILCCPVEGDPHVVLHGDLTGNLHPNPAHQMPTDRHAQDRRNVADQLVRVASQLHPPGLAPAPHRHLGLDHHRPIEILSHDQRLLDRAG